jgi:transmembrane sensor
MTEPLAKYVQDPASEERLEKIWQAVDARREEYRPLSSRRQWLLLASGCAVAAGVLLGWFFGAPFHEEREHALRGASQTSTYVEAGAALRTSGEKLAVDLEDGSKVTLAPRSRVRMQETHADDVALNLEVGRVACQVAKDKGRTFSVLAGEVTVRVIGTTFSVERLTLGSEEKITVEVSEGIVEVEGPDSVEKRLGAGESWSVRVATEKADAHTAEFEGGKTPAPALEQQVTRPAPAAAATKEKERDLFAEARKKRNAGDAAGAAELYQSFLQKFPKDGRSGVAALELGRLRMDELGDPAGAIAPLTQAARGVGGGLGDDALARLVRAHAALGQASACKSARARYLERYPEGVHVERVRMSCP